MQGERLVSPDALTGVPALERKHPARPPRPGQVERRECEYIRHGTSSCIISRDVARGQIIAPSCGPTRTAADFLAHLHGGGATDPRACRWHGVVDPLDIHRSASLVRWVAAASDLDLELGVKGKRGMRPTRQSRAAFLSDSPHRIGCHSTPNHSAWLNQIAIWLSILVRKLIKRGSFTSIADLQQKVFAFIAYSNRTLAKPFQWTSQGKALTA